MHTTDLGSNGTESAYVSNSTRSKVIAEGPRDALSVEILTTAARLHEKSNY